MEIKRDIYLNKVIRGMHNGLIKVVTGPRRCGKSYLLGKLFYDKLISSGVKGDHVISIALDDRMNKRLRDPDNLLDFLRSSIKDDEMYYIILDEIQKTIEFEDVLNSLLHIKNADVYVTGSNSKFLSSDIATEFRGRDYQVRMWPLSFSEFCSAKGDDLNAAWSEYFTYGGLPQILSFTTDEDKVQYLYDVFHKVYLSDLLERYQIKNEAELEKLVKILASSIGSSTNPLKIANTFKTEERSSISSATIEKYIGYLVEAFLVEKAERYDLKGRKYIGTLSKYYFDDIGIRNVVIDFRQQEENHIMENIIYNELCIRGYLVDVGNIDVRSRDDDGKQYRSRLEVDFIANKGSRRLYIQSAFAIPDEAKREQEIRSLLQIDDSFQKIVVVKDRIKPWSDENGILFISLFDFLLGKVVEL